MKKVIASLRRILYAMVFVSMGILAGTSMGIFWATNQALGLSKYNTAQALIAAEDTIRKQYKDLRQSQSQIESLQRQIEQLRNQPTPKPQKVYIPAETPAQTDNLPAEYYTGEDLMQSVNKYRREHGVPELELHSGLCQLASRRLGEILSLGELDNHAGFEAYFNQYEISELSGPSLTNVAENLASGYPSAWEAVMGWDGSPPHRTFLLADGSYKWGCGAANRNFAVLIGGF